jgi:hypothetical protein
MTRRFETSGNPKPKELLSRRNPRGEVAPWLLQRARTDDRYLGASLGRRSGIADGVMCNDSVAESVLEKVRAAEVP